MAASALRLRAALDERSRASLAVLGEAETPDARLAGALGYLRSLTVVATKIDKRAADKITEAAADALREQAAAMALVITGEIETLTERRRT